MAHTPLLLPTVAFCLGLGAHSLVADSAESLWAAGALTLCLSWILWSRKRAWSCWIVVLLAFVLSGMAWKAVHELQFGGDHLRTLVRSGALDLTAPCRVRGRCVRVSDGKAGGIHLEVEVQHLANRFASFETRGKDSPSPSSPRRFPSTPGHLRKPAIRSRSSPTCEDRRISTIRASSTIGPTWSFAASF